MTKLVICLLLFGIYAIQTVAGHMNSDPAPGRSPGPPLSAANNSKNTSTSTSSRTSNANVTSELASLSGQLPVLAEAVNGGNSYNNFPFSSSIASSSAFSTTTDIYKNNEATAKQRAEKETTRLNASNQAGSNWPQYRNINFELGESPANKQEDEKESSYTYMEQEEGEDTTLAAQQYARLQAEAVMAATSADSVQSEQEQEPDVETEAELLFNSQLPHGRNGSAAYKATHDKLHVFDAAATASLTAATIKPFTGAATKTKAGSSCRTALSELLNDVVVIDELEAEAEGVENDVPHQAPQQQLPRLHMQLQLEHDVFDTTTAGINCGLMYKVRFITKMNTSLPFGGITPPMPSGPVFAPHYTGEFFVETLSTRNGRERGSFVGQSLGNKLPISWFSTLQRNAKGVDATLPLHWLTSHDDDDDESSSGVDVSKNEFNFASASEEDNLTFRHDYDAAAAAGDSFQQQQHYQQETFLNKWPARDTSTRQHIATPLDAGRTNRGENVKACPDNKWQSSCKSRSSSSSNNNNSLSMYTSTESVQLWMLNELCEQDETVEFRVFFRATLQQRAASVGDNDEDVNNTNSATEEGTPSAEPMVVVYRKTFRFQIRKDCQLLLREATSGQLDYTALPLYSIDCTVHFPSYNQHLYTAQSPSGDTKTAESNSLPFPSPPGILIELQRLNVPCNNGGFVRFNERSELCGKLEELPPMDRSYHFDVRQTNAVRFYKNPMFSLSYKLVDYCYNVTTSNQTGEYYIQPSMQDSVECFFRIHLPYGNRVLLRLVANNESDIVQEQATAPAGNDDAFTGGVIFEAEEAYTIYTSQNVIVPSQTINLTLNSDGFDTLAHVVAPAIATLFGSGATVNVTSGKHSTNSLLLLPLFSGGHVLSAAAHCEGVIVKVFENEFSKWSHCINDTTHMRGFVIESSSNTLSVHLYKAARSRHFYSDPNHQNSHQATQDKAINLPAIYLSYQARPVPEIVSNCAFGWVAMQQFCISASELVLSWDEAEQHCVNLGGHLVSIRNEMQQQVISQLLVRSPGYSEQNAYWVGGSDKSYEGDFRWSDGLPFQYTNWFPGWSQHGHYNKQPNDDGLSSQDCIELRRYFRTPPGIQSNRSPLTSNFMWNDRDCTAKNFLVCERAMSEESLRRNWINDCNKTVSLTKEHPRASIWSPSFPRQYPDNANCYTTITAPTGYRIVIEFEELVIESEPGCTYDYLEITEPTNSNSLKTPKSSKHNKHSVTSSSSSNNNNSNANKTFRKRNSYENPSLSSSYTSASTTNTNTNANANFNTFTNNNYNNNFNNNAHSSAYVNSNGNNNNNNNLINNVFETNNYNNYNLAQTNYQKMFQIYSNLYKPHTNFVIQTPDYPKGNPYYNHHHAHTQTMGFNAGTGSANHQARTDEVLPKRLCGDWSSKLKLLRHVSASSYVGLHFVSDYSHHFGGYKAKTYMENTASECANERLKPYNGFCYLFVSYPEADWGTAQQVCRGMGAKLASVSTSDEHRFITSNIRNQIDYSPQLIYWLGAELEKSGQFEWTDDTKMSFQGWLPGQGQFDVLPADATCLGLQWKMSPTPMLPSGLYWQSQKCNKVGGYVCKKPKESFGKFAFSNFTVTGAEGRLVSPAYPNTYPLNIDYWIHIKSPERTRIVVQFQKIDLEPQDECLYDFISIQNYEFITKITLEPGTNPMPMAMLASEELFTDEDDDESMQTLHNSAATGRAKRSTLRGNHWSTKDTAKARSQDTVNDVQNLRNSGVKSQLQNSALKRKWFRRSSDHQRSVVTAEAESGSAKNWHKSSTTEGQENPKRRRRKRNTRRAQIKQQNHFRSGAIKQRHHHHIRPQQGRPRRSASGILGDGVSAPPSADNAQSFLPYVRWCGSHDTNMSKFDFVSSSNEVVLNFHSDYSVTGIGFAAVWKAIDISGCPGQTLTSREGIVFSPNYPHFLLNNLNCEYVIQAPSGKRIWLEFTRYDLESDAILEIDTGNGFYRPFRGRDHLNDGLFVSLREQLRVHFRTGQHPRGNGFSTVYHTVGQMERRDRIISLTNDTTGNIFQLNYPNEAPVNVDFTQHLVAPFGDNILLELFGVEFTENGCPDHNILEIYDTYADKNGTKWTLCKFPTAELRNENSPAEVAAAPDGLHFGSTEENPLTYGGHHLLVSAHNRMHSQQFPPPPVYITSYLNTLHIRQRITTKADANLNATVRTQWDNNYKMKLTTGEKTVESCQPNPCQYGGKCVLNNGSNYCQCQGHFTGRFCALTICDLDPCLFGKCELTPTHFKCQCQPGYMGATCEQKQRPCADNPCEGRGICTERNGVYHCRCHAWWEGHRCERRMMHIPYKPLSERMLQEPFWLGLITVFVVLAVIGLFWCAKRHFPEKIEKLLAEEADRNRPPGSIHGHHHHTSLREQLQFTTAIPQTTVNNAPGAPRSIFNRLGIRKPSLLSLSSPNPTPGGGGAAARTFSLDDLLRPPPRRSPSPRKKRNNSTPVKKNAAEKKQILQQLVSPAAVQAKPKVSLDELISMSENRLRVTTVDSESDLKETTFSENSGSMTSTAAAAVTVARTITDPKLEKKVTFARLLNKVSAEMSSGSEMDIGQMGCTRNSSALSLPTDIQFRASSMPPSPCTNDLHSTSSNQGSDSLSSSDLALTDFGLRSLQIVGAASDISAVNSIAMHSSNNPLGLTQRCRLGSTTRPKVSSADSILAMFRNFASTATTASNTTTALIASNASIFISPSTTPTASSPQDDALGDDESSTSSMHTPVSFSSGAPDSPVFYRQTTIEVPVLDVLNAHKTSSPSSSTSSSSTNLLHPPTILLEIPSNGINKCLSPIREMPTPIPSPALTPIMPRPQRSNSPVFQEHPLCVGDFSDDEDDKSDQSDRSDAQLSEQILLGLRKKKSRLIDIDVETAPTDTTTTSVADASKQQTSYNLPMLRLSPAPISPTNALAPPVITIGIESPTPEERAQRPRDLIIPTLTVEQPSPTKNRHPMIIFPGSPPPQRASIGETSFMFPNKQQQKRLLKQYEKPNSLDFPFVPPMITITSNMSELESDTEPLSPATKKGAVGGLMPPNPVGMCYLSPFTMCSRADRTISESNLSSSGYSSMASPGPSRCGSSNPLCPNEMDEPGSGHSGAGLSLHMSLLNRRKSSALASCKENVTNGKSGGGPSNSAGGSNTDQLRGHRPRSDSETFSDDILLESNDEGISTDHVDDKLEDTRLRDRRLKELDIFMEEQVLIEVEEPPSPVGAAAAVSAVPLTPMAQLQLPSIVIQIEGGEKGGYSPVSSRSESPLSERAGIGRFSPHFYGRKDQLPFTDSDGLYDFPSSDGKGGTSAQTYTHQRRSSSKKRERKSSKCSATQSPTKQQLDVPLSKESLNTTSTTPSSSITHHVCNKHCHSHHHPCPASVVTTRKSPKRRQLNRLPIASSSSSSESLTSTKDLAVRPLPRRLNSPNREKRPRKQESLSEEEVADALLRRISPSIVKEDDSAKPKCKINRLRAIGNQIRFLRRLEKSIKTRERIASPTDSCPEENTDDMDSPQATSPLLQPTSPTKARIGLCRQKRLSSGTYGITSAALNSVNWKGMDRSLIEDELNSD